MAQATDCLYSSVRNVSGSSQNFSFLGPHGMTLADGGEFTIIGNILNTVAQGCGSSQASRRQAALLAAISAGLLIIKYTPPPLITDSTQNRPVILAVTNGSIVTQDPCWASAA